MDKERMDEKVHSLEEIVNYIPNATVNKQLLKKATGEIQLINYYLK